ncbi:MAG: hypothetical protein ACXVB4_14325, partial [Pseudobdellovibrionaceae bacterium]
NNREALLFKEKLIAGQKAVREVADCESLSQQLSFLVSSLEPSFSSLLHQELIPLLHSSHSVVAWCAKNLTQD